MHIVVFGLTISSSWGNGHATLWRSLVKAMLRRGHTVSFYERSTPYYAGARDLQELPAGGRLCMYGSLEDVREEAVRDLGDASLAIATSYCYEGAAACELILESRAEIKAFYDLDTPMTLSGLRDGKDLKYLPTRGLGDFDMVLSYTGGRALDELKTRVGARRVAPLYGSVDPENHRPAAPREEFRASLSYLGTYAEDRQEALQKLFLRAAARLPQKRFLIGGAQYPDSFPWMENVAFVRHVPPPMHPEFFSSCRATLNITRSAMASYGYCPSGRLFEAAACGAPLLTDSWEGLECFFEPGREVLRVSSADDVVSAMALSDGELRAIGDAARERALAEHTGDRRVAELEAICAQVFDKASQREYA
jgi:spore maturation protein CgeB